MATSTRQWTVPGGVRSISIVAVGGGGGGGAEFLGGGGGGGGALAYRNTIDVKPGETFTINAGPGGASVNSRPDGGIGGNGGDSFVQRNSNGEYLIYAGGGQGGEGSPYDFSAGNYPPPKDPGWKRPNKGGAGGNGDVAIAAQTRRKGGNGGDGLDSDAQGGGGAAAGYRSNGSSGQNTDGSGAPIVNGGPRGGEADDSTNGTAQGGGGVGLYGSTYTGFDFGAGGSGGGDRR